jgi:hypothetical protein
MIIQVKNNGILNFFIFFGLFSQPGKLIIFLYPFPSTGESGGITPFEISEGVKISPLVYFACP